MLRYFCKTVWSHWRANPVLYGLTILGVALGVASVISIQILNQGAIASFAAGVRTVNGEADVIVTGKGAGLPDRAYAQILGTSGVASAWPVFDSTVSVKESPQTFVRVLGVNLLTPVHAVSGALSGLEPGAGAVAAVHEPGWAAISPDLGSAMGWAIGDRFEVLSGSNIRELRVGAFIDSERLGATAGRKVVVMDIAQAQSLFGGVGMLRQVGVKALEGAEVESLVDRLEGRLGDGASVATPGERTEEAQRLLAAFRLNLTALSFVSLMVGTFLVFSSMRACLVWQRREFGILRSLGATPGQVLGLIVGEAILLALIGVAVGTPVGYWTAVWNLDAVSSTLANIYKLGEVESLEISIDTAALAICVGMGGALSGTGLPALDIWRRDTRALLEVPASGSNTARKARNLFWMGLAVVAGTLAWYWLAGWRWRPSGFVLATAVLVGLPMLTPFVVRLVARAVRVPDFGFRYGVRSLGASLANTSFSVSALAMAICLLVGITLLVESFRDTLAAWVQRSLRADIYVTTVTGARATTGSSLGADVVERLSRRPDVRQLDPLRRLFLRAGGRRVSVGGVDLGQSVDDARFILLSGNEEATVRRAFREGGVLIGEPLAWGALLGVGDTLEIEGPKGAVRFPIAGVYYDYTEGGSVTMDIGLMERTFGPGAPTSVALYLVPHANSEAVVESIKAQFPAGSLVVRSNRRLKDEVLELFDQTFAVTRILQIMSLIIAACAITLTLLVVAQEKSSEIALYQTLGAYRRQILWLFVNKGTAMAALGIVLGFLGGIGLGAILIFVIQKSYFGWSIQWVWPWALMAAEVLAILLAAVLASLYPAFKASRTPATELCRADA